MIYIHTKCSTCQKALEFLAENKIEITVKDITKEPPSPQELEKMLAFQKGNLTRLLNTSGQLYRDMQLSKKLKDMTLPDIFSLLSAHGMLIKRPFLLGSAFGLTGFKESEWAQELLGSSFQCSPKAYH